MKTKWLLNFALVLTLSMTEAHAGIPEFPVIYKDMMGGQVVSPYQRMAMNLDRLELTPLQITPAGIVAHFTELVHHLDGLINTPAPEVALEADLSEVITEPETLTITANKPFWTRTKVVLTGGLLLVTGLIIALVGILASSSSGSGSTSGSGGNNSQFRGNNPNPNPNGPNDPNFSSGPNGGGPNGPEGPHVVGAATSSDNPFNNPNIPGKIPANPEPSTLLMAGLGLLIPYFRKGRK